MRGLADALGMQKRAWVITRLCPAKYGPVAKTAIYIDTPDGPVPLLKEPFVNCAEFAASDHKLFVKKALECLEEIYG